MSEQESIRAVEEFFAARDWERWAQLHAENAYHAEPVTRKLPTYRVEGGTYP
jgi:hypothetical protein